MLVCLLVCTLVHLQRVHSRIPPCIVVPGYISTVNINCKSTDLVRYFPNFPIRRYVRYNNPDPIKIYSKIFKFQILNSIDHKTVLSQTFYQFAEVLVK